MLIRADRVKDCLAVALASRWEPPPMNWATMAKAPVVAVIIIMVTTMVRPREMPTAEIASGPRSPTM